MIEPLHYRETGEGKQTLIILHGLFGSSDNWLTVTKELAKDYHLLIPDARNHGRSPHFSDHNYDVMADDLLAFIQHLQIKNPILIGHSMGGKTVMKFAKKYPSVAAAYVVIDISPKYYTPHHQSILAALNAVPMETITSRQEAEDILKSYIYDYGVLQFLMKNLYRKDEGKFGWRMNLKDLNREIDNIGEGLEDDTVVALPTLFIRGSESDYIEDFDVKLIHKIFQHVSIETIEGAGHWVQAEKPQAFIEVLTMWLKKHHFYGGL